MSPSASLPLLTGNITLSDALEEEEDILQKLTYPEKRLDFCSQLHLHARDIEAIASHHLGVAKEACRIPWVDEWIHGSFNMCVPVYVHGEKRAVMRFPLPYKIGESTHPGNAEEKLRCEAATYAWMQSHCPSVPIPRLWGFGLPDGPSFTTLPRAPVLSRLAWYMRCFTRWILRKPIPSSFAIHCHQADFSLGYLLLDFVDGQMLSQTWDHLRSEPPRRTTLYRDISQIMLSLAKIPFPRIGSLTIDNDCIVALTHRPLTFHLHQLENGGIPTNIPRALTYTSSDTYLLDLLACHDNRMRHRPNTILDQSDGQSQLSTLTIMRALFPQFTNRELRHGAFPLMLNDLHPSNIFVDQDWHITCLIDLEWACSRPLEMLQPPHWLTGQAIDRIYGQNLIEYGEQHEEFMSIFEKEEETFTGATPYAHLMRTGLKTGSFWYFNALDSLNGLYNIFRRNVQPIYGDEAVKNWRECEQAAAPYWEPHSSDFIRHKLEEREQYQDRIIEAFQKGEQSG